VTLSVVALCVSLLAALVATLARVEASGWWQQRKRARAQAQDDDRHADGIAQGLGLERRKGETTEELRVRTQEHARQNYRYPRGPRA